MSRTIPRQAACVKLACLMLPACLLLAACGFHLRGSQVQTAAPSVPGVALVDATAEQVGTAVRAQLEAAGIPVVQAMGGAAYSLHLSGQTLDRSVLSVSAETGKVEEYQLTLRVSMSVVDSIENEVISGQPIQVTRDYPFDEQSVLGAVAEQRVLEQEMIQQAATQILRRLETVTRD